MNSADLLSGYNKEIEKMGTGSAEYQIASLTASIKHITQHLLTYKKDYSAKHGLLKQVSKRSKMLKYIKSEDESRYRSLISHLGLRK